MKSFLTIRYMFWKGISLYSKGQQTAKCHLKNTNLKNEIIKTAKKLKYNIFMSLLKFSLYTTFMTYITRLPSALSSAFLFLTSLSQQLWSCRDGQCTLPHFSWATLTYFANILSLVTAWQHPFLEENFDHRNFTINLQESNWDWARMEISSAYFGDTDQIALTSMHNGWTEGWMKEQTDSKSESNIAPLTFAKLGT